MSKKSLKITLDIPPIPKGRPRTVSNGKRTWTYTPVRTKDTEIMIQTIMNMNGYRDYFEANVPLKLMATFYVAEPVKSVYDYPVTGRSGDCDNLAKTVLDACNKFVFPDDAQICQLHLRKVYDTQPRIELEITEL